MQGVKELATLWTLLLWFVTDFVPGDFQQGQETLVEVVGLQVLLLVVNVLSLGLSPPLSGLLFSLLPGRGNGGLQQWSHSWLAIGVLRGLCRPVL